MKIDFFWVFLGQGACLLIGYWRGWRHRGQLAHQEHLRLVNNLRNRASDRALMADPEFQESLEQMHRGEGRTLRPKDVTDD